MIAKVQIVLSVFIIVALLALPALASAFSPVGILTNQLDINSLGEANERSLSSITLKAISAGGNHTCALTTDGGVWCWGANNFGQLGNGTTVDSHFPVSVSGLSNEVTAVAAGGSHTCALMVSGGVKCWGNNMWGQLGDGTTTNHSSPVDVSGLASAVTKLATGDGHTCALTSEDELWCWGRNYGGQLGDNSQTNRSVSVKVTGLASQVNGITAGGHITCAWSATAGAQCWGDNSQGQLGIGSTDGSLVPVNVTDLSSGVAAMSAGFLHTCASLTDGGAKCWGYNLYGQLGDDTYTGKSTPVAVSNLAEVVTVLAAGGNHTCVLVLGGGVKCWGPNDKGQLGIGAIPGSKTPVDVSDLSGGVITIAAGANHTCALMQTGGARCWGSNSSGQLGDWSTTTRYTPVDVVFPTGYCYLPLVTRNYCPDFYDDFSNPASGWPVGEDTFVRAEYLNSEYRVLVKLVEYLFGAKAPSCSRLNYIAEVNTHWGGNSGLAYGLLFGIVGNYERFYTFLVNTDSQGYALLRYDGADNWYGIQPMTYSSAIHTGATENNLRVSRNGSYISLFINGTNVGNFGDETITGETGAGVIVMSYIDLPNADARFDDFRIQTVLSPGAPVFKQDTPIGLMPSSSVDLPGLWFVKDLSKQLEIESGWKK